MVVKHKVINKNKDKKNKKLKKLQIGWNYQKTQLGRLFLDELFKKQKNCEILRELKEKELEMKKI